MCSQNWRFRLGGPNTIMFEMIAHILMHVIKKNDIVRTSRTELLFVNMHQDAFRQQNRYQIYVRRQKWRFRVGGPNNSDFGMIAHILMHVISKN